MLAGRSHSQTSSLIVRIRIKTITGVHFWQLSSWGEPLEEATKAGRGTLVNLLGFALWTGSAPFSLRTCQLASSNLPSTWAVLLGFVLNGDSQSLRRDLWMLLELVLRHLLQHLLVWQMTLKLFTHSLLSVVVLAWCCHHHFLQDGRGSPWPSSQSLVLWGP